MSVARSRRLFLVLAIVMAAGSALLAHVLGDRGLVGRHGEEALNAAGAVALATGHGYTYLFGPEAVAATRFPPLFPLLLVPAVWLGGMQVAAGGAATGSAIGAGAHAGVGSAIGAASWMHLMAVLVTFGFVLLAYGALRRLLDLSPVVSLAATSGVALHPVLARFGGALLADLLAAALSLAALIVAARVEARIEARAWQPREDRLLVPVVLGADGPVVLGPGGLIVGTGGSAGAFLGSPGSGGDPGAGPQGSGFAGNPGCAEPGDEPATGRDPFEASAASASELAGIAVIPRKAPEAPRGLGVIWRGWGLADWWPVGLLAALAVLARYEAIVAVVAIGLALITRKRWREAASVVGFAGVLVLPWAVWALTHQHAAPGILPHQIVAQVASTGALGAQGPGQFNLGNVPGALWQGLGRVLPGLLVPQAFMAGYPLGAEGAPHMARVPVGIVAFWGLLVSASLAGPLWRLRSASTVAARAACFFAFGTLAVALMAYSRAPAGGWDLAVRQLLPAAPLFVAAVWMWKAGEHRFERAAAERFKGLVALGWLAAVILFSPVALGPVRSDAGRFEATRTEYQAVMDAVGRLALPEDLVATIRPGSVWLYTGRHATDLPLEAPDFPGATREAGAGWLVTEPLVVDGRDVVQDALTKASAAEPDWARPVFATGGRKMALFQVSEPLD